MLLGPYPLFVRREANSSVGRRLRTPQEVAQVREDIAAYDRFMALCEEFVQATEELADVERAQAAVLEAGAKVLQRLLEPVGVGRRETKVSCTRCAATTESHGTCAKDGADWRIIKGRKGPKKSS